MRGLTDLHRTRGGDTGCTFVKVQAGVLPWEFKGANKLSCVGFKVSRRRFIADIDNASGELMSEMRHQIAIASMMACHLALVVGV